MKLNLGCGKHIKEGYINLDRIALEGVDVVHNLDTFPYPFMDNTFDEILCSHVLEHVDDLIKAMEELHRICKPKARIKVIAPYFSAQGAFSDPTHRHFFTWRTFEYFSKAGYYSKSVFRTVKRKIFFFPSKSRTFMRGRPRSLLFDFFINLLPMVYQRFFCWILPASEIHYLIEVEK